MKKKLKLNLEPEFSDPPKAHIKCDFNSLCEDIMEKILIHDPVMATCLGCHKYDNFLPDSSIEATMKGLDILKDGLARLDEFNKDHLTEEQIMDRELFRWQTDLLDVSITKARRHLMGGFPVEGFLGAIHPLYVKNFAPIEERVHSIIGRLNGAPEYFKAAKKGFVHPVIIFVNDEIYSCDSGVDFIDSIVQNLEDRISAETFTQLKDGAKIAKGEMEAFSAWLKEDVKPRSTMDYKLGRELLDLHVERRRLGLNTDEIRQLGREEFDRLQLEIEEETKKLGASSVDEAVKEMQQDVPEGFPAILKAYKEAISYSKQLVKETDFATLPDDETLTIEQTPVHLERTIPSAAYEPPEAFSKAPHEGTYLVTRPLSKEHVLEHNLASIQNVSFHEAYPGHHLQLVYASRNKSTIRKIINGIEFVEGWAHYCEEEMYFLAREPQKGLRLAQLLDARYRALRIELDLGLHCGDISYEESQELMISKLGLSKETAEAETGWYCRQPGYAMSYLLGKILFKRLRKECEKKEGANFSMKKFHDKVLQAGSLPMWAIREIMLK